HVVLEDFASKGSRTVEDRPIKVFVKTDLSSFERGDHHLVAIVKFLLIKLELFKRAFPLCAVQRIGEQHPADVPKYRADPKQRLPPRKIIVQRFNNLNTDATRDATMNATRGRWLGGRERDWGWPTM